MEGGGVILCRTGYISDIDIGVGEEGKHVGFGQFTYIDRVDVAFMEGVHVTVW